MKKVLLLLALCVVLVAIFASCGESETTTKPATTGQKPVATQPKDPVNTGAPESSKTNSSTETPTTDEFGNVSTDVIESAYVENGLTYTIYKDGAKLISAEATAAEITVPAKIKNGTVVVKSIAFRAFKNNETITKVTIENGITSIGKEAFYGCFNLKELTLSNTLTTLGEGAFRNCYALEKAVLPNTLTTMGTDVFFECRSLKEVTLPTNAEFVAIPAMTFYNCKSLEEITVPVAVTTLETKAFYYCTALKNFTFGSNITTLGEKVFYNCIALTAVDLSESNVTTIPAYAFYRCSAITSLKMADNSVSIGEYAFYGCESLTALTVPSTVESVAVGAFAYCTNVKTIQLPEAIKTIPARTFYKCQALETVTVASDITSIGEAAFAYTALNKFTVPATVTEMAKGAFSYCTALKSVNFAEGFAMTKFSQNLFSNCTALEAIHIPESVTAIDSGVFNTCSALTEVKLSSATTDIGQNAFLNCTALEEIIIPDSVTKIGRNGIGMNLDNNVATPNKNLKIYAFEGGEVGKYFDGLGIMFTSLGISGYVPFADLDVQGTTGVAGEYELFEYRGSLTELAIHESYIEYVRIPVKAMKIETVNTTEVIKTVTIGSTVYNVTVSDTALKIAIPAKSETEPEIVFFSAPDAKIRAYSNEGNDKFIEIVKTSKITKLAENFMKDNTNVVSVKLPDTIKEIGVSAFEGCTALTTVNIPAKLTVIAKNTFKGSGLTELTSVKEITKIGASAFEGCTALTAVKFDNNSKLVEIGEKAFAGSAITSFTISKNVTKIGASAFENCASLAEVKSDVAIFTEIGDNAFANTAIATISIPKTVTKIGNNVFANCQKLLSVELKGTAPAIGTGVLDGTTPLTAFHIDAANAESYNATEGMWNGYPVTTAKVSDAFKTYEFKAEDGTVTVTVNLLYNGTLTVTGADKTAVLPDFASAEETPWYEYRTYITSITVTSVSRIGNYAFAGISGIETLALSDSNLVELGDYAFKDMTSLKTVTITSSITTIGKGAFMGTAIDKITLPKTVTTIGDEAFANCASLVDVILQGTAPTVGKDVLKDSPETAQFRYPAKDTTYTVEEGKWNGYLASPTE